ncbi:MAG: NAD-dependent epimerase/dehydratase family protein [Pseudomonadales bacterium]|nr:NAD-dependent epimerase/dehydratase family protein [Pseudomonadales bacterium]
MNDYFLNKNVLITGGAGFIGSHLARKLALLGSKVSIIDNLSRGNINRLIDIKDKINFYKADVTNLKSSQKYFKNQEIIFNLAALNTGVDFDLGRTEVMFEQNMLLQMMPLKMSQKSGSVKRFIQASSASIYSTDAMVNQIPTPESAAGGEPEKSKLGYALAKQMGEYLANWYYKDTGLDTVIVRFINVYGEDDNYDEMGHFIPVVIRKFIEADKKVEIFGSGNQKRSFIYVDDVVNALLVLAERGVAGEVYNVDSNCEKTVKEVVELIAKFFNDKKLKIFYDTTKPEGSQRRMLDSSKLRSLGWKSKTEFKIGLYSTIQNIYEKF